MADCHTICKIQGFSLILQSLTVFAMKRGKRVCETLKGIRADIARANDIDYTPAECRHEGDCAGTCPACEVETRWLERQLRLRRQLGKAVAIAGVSLTMGAFAAQGTGINQAENQQVVTRDSTEYRVYGEVPGERPPAFRGGETALIAYLAEHIVLPDSLKHVSGRIVTQFIVNPDGTVSDVRVVRDPIGNLTVNAIITDVLEHLPRFRPATRGGSHVEYTYTLPIVFKGDNTHDDDQED